ncbi:MAG: hypothetical protein ACYC40_05165, partial [Patescibacteria group bacterium]
MSAKEKISNKIKENSGNDLPPILNEGDVNQKKDIETEVTAEIKEKAKESLLKSIDTQLIINRALTKEDLESELSKAIQNLPRYKELAEKLKDASKDDFTHEVFKLIRQSADKDNRVHKNTPIDGVLINSMKTGLLKCAGRVMIASELFKQHQINHSIGQAPNHSIIIGRLNEDTLVYFDGQSNLYFTFPKQALTGYISTASTNECVLNDYIPRDSDKSDGLNGVWRHIVVMPPSEGVLRQYFGNMGAALNGNEEFKYSGIKKDKEQAAAVHDLGREVLGDNSVYNKFQDNTPNLAKESMNVFNAQEQALKNMFNESPDKNDFIEKFSLNKNDVVKIFPYLKNAPDK